ncbi:putative UPF0463 transmembrane protein C6orf35 [Tripterygium wilfordii]|uniref:Putative UPF0463 transmembrane protein C6orf35 n=1 Tax=Tripterygium wilfordii TaxID=458696 RepID=A0A7J7D6N9_TRIWF|nr:putative UPF0463 transmembrane protein C6orf35 [Tripterygium wilfordii]
MAGTVPTKKTLNMVLLTISCTAILVSAGLAYETPPFILPGVPEIVECWLSLTSIEGCVAEIYKLLVGGKIGVVGPDCCNAVTEIKDKCWPKMFPFSPVFPPLLHNSCAKSA